MKFDISYFQDEVREGFYIPGMIKRAWAVQLDMLEVIGKICDEHKIKWYAEGGTLLGAVRHRGFIPWDDDIDICMMRDDYVRFCKVVKEELPEGSGVLNFETESKYRNFLTRITNCKGINMGCSFLMKHHGFPYVAGIDVFPLDYIIPDEEKEEDRRQRARFLWEIVKNIIDGKEKRTKDEIIEVAEMLSHVCVDRSIPLELSLLRNIDSIFAEYSGEDSEYVALMPYWISEKKLKYPLKCFKDCIELPFENTYLKCPAGYGEFLKMDYGKWEHASKKGGAHEYPFYEEQEKILLENQGAIPYQYEMKDLNEIKNEERLQHAIMADSNLKILQSLKQLHDMIFEINNRKDYNTVLQLLEKCQEYAIKVGTDIEIQQGENFITVRLLEDYCEQIYLIHQRIYYGESITEAKEKVLLDGVIKSILESYEKDIKKKREVLFLPVKAVDWNSMELLYKEFVQDSQSNVYVMPIPYIERESDGNSGVEHYDIDSFPDYLNIVDYRKYDFARNHPDVIVIQNPYDEYESGMTIHPFFYAKNIKKYTNKLVYLPYFEVDEIDLEDEKSIRNSKAYIITPGVVHSDEVIVSSEATKDHYVKFLVKHTIIKDSKEWEKKIVVRKDIRKKTIQVVKNIDKIKVVLFYIGFSDFYIEGKNVIKNIRSAIEQFVLHKDKIKVYWVTEDFFVPNLMRLCSEIYEDYSILVSYFEQQKIGECIKMKEIEKIVLDTDIFYGSGGYIMNLCERKGVQTVVKDWNK